MNVTKILAHLFLAAASIAHAAQSPDEDARFLAGLPVKDAGLAALEARGSWTTHASRLSSAWNRMDERQLSKVSAWAAANLGSAHGSTASVFYFFSGPDFLYAHTFFPNASNYILCGTEPVGTVPDMTQMPPAALEADLENLRRSLGTMLTTHYFITKDMRVDLTRGSVGGTLPILYFFLARTGCTIRGVSASAASAQIDFIGASGKKQTLYYFKTDLSNGGSNGAFLNFCRQHGPGMSLVKSASYLMHGDSFSTARNFLLANSSIIIQDDSGITFRAFDPKRWNVRCYGNYEGPIELFKDHHQPDLTAAFQRSSAPLGFSFGYAWQQSKGALIVATPH
jgi:hypothetical protein